MKLHITFKSPDAVTQAIDDAARENLPEGLIEMNAVVQDELISSRKEELKEKLAKWVKYEEYVTIEVDTVKGTAKVLPAT